MTDLTDTNYFDKPPDNVILRYLPRAMMVAIVMVATGFWYTNLIFNQQSPKSNASEINPPPIQLPTSVPSISPTPTTTLLKK